ASLRHLRMAPRKVRLVVDLVRGLPVAEALQRLTFLQKDASLPVRKLIESAIANAEHNFKLDKSTLVVKAIAADGGATLKRWRPRAHGRAAPIRKRTTHITLILAPASEIVPSKRAVKKAAATKKKAVAPSKATSKPRAPKKAATPNTTA
ncbi:50S ribosomal protein L22, partial [Patescibacteria group bacterium]|nr:50S ribosomal protein L22 [Patescibacteria group bacterium]MBU1448723.1 50S ribosomal protein L22 [Patescibacteria group bacterium]